MQDNIFLDEILEHYKKEFVRALHRKDSDKLNIYLSIFLVLSPAHYKAAQTIIKNLKK